MSIFNHYAQYYDLLYTTKNYEVEVNYVDTLIKKYTSEARTILDLGCGTGTHDLYLAKKGYQVTGIDLSDNMISIAQEKQDKEDIKNIDFRQGNIVSLNLNKQYDVVVSLFHVMNYLTENSDLQAGFLTTARHLKKGGVFIFDCWYGPAVLSDLPKTGVKRLENEKINVIRIVEPELHWNRNVVDVNYEIIIEERSTQKIATIHETHSVRYFFMPELKLLLAQAGMEIVNSEEWVTSKDAGKNTFGVCFVVRKL
jgi:predicted TPR repeat methyltransferase